MPSLNFSSGTSPITATNRLIRKKYEAIQREPQQNKSYLSRIWKRSKTQYHQHVKSFNQMFESEDDSTNTNTGADQNATANNAGGEGGAAQSATALTRIAGSNVESAATNPVNPRFGQNDGEALNPTTERNLVNYTPDFDYMGHFTYGSQNGSHRISKMTTPMQALIKGISNRENQRQLATEAMSAMARGDDRLLMKFIRGTYVKNVPISGRASGTGFSIKAPIPAANHILGDNYTGTDAGKRFGPNYLLLHALKARLKNLNGDSWEQNLGLIRELADTNFVAITSVSGWYDFVRYNDERFSNRDYYGKDLITKSYDTYRTIADFPIITLPDSVYNSKFERYVAGSHVAPYSPVSSSKRGNVVTSAGTNANAVDFGLGDASELDVQWKKTPDLTLGLAMGAEVGTGSTLVSPYGMFSMFVMPTFLYAFHEPEQLRKPVRFRERPDLEWETQLFGRHNFQGMRCFENRIFRLFWTPLGRNAVDYTASP